MWVHIWAKATVSVEIAPVPGGTLHCLLMSCLQPQTSQIMSDRECFRLWLSCSQSLPPQLQPSFNILQPFFLTSHGISRHLPRSKTAHSYLKIRLPGGRQHTHVAEGPGDPRPSLARAQHKTGRSGHVFTIEHLISYLIIINHI